MKSEKEALAAGQIYDGESRGKFSEHEGRVRASVRKTARSLGVTLQEDVIEDLVQETFLKLLARRAAREVACLPAYLSRTARNVTIDAVRRRRAKKRDERLTTSLSAVAAISSPGLNPEERVTCRSELGRALSLLRRRLEPVEANSIAEGSRHE